MLLSNSKQGGNLVKGTGVPRTAVFALLLLFVTAFWGFVPALIYITTGWRLDPQLAWHSRLFSSGGMIFLLTK